MLDIYATLEIKEVLDEVASFSHSEVSKVRFKNLKMLPTKKEVIDALKSLDEMISLSLAHGRLPIEASFDVSKYVELAFKDGVLTPLEFSHLLNDIETAISIRNMFIKLEKHKFFNLFSLVENLYDLSSLKDDINRVISPNLSINDNASSELKRIRHQILSTEQEVRRMSLSLVNKYRDYLTESAISIRNDHFVLAVKSAEKSKVSGVIHDISDSGQTTFIEPSMLVDLSNELYLLHKSESEEIYRLLKELTSKVASLGGKILNNNKIIGELDFIDAKASYAIKHDCYVSSVSDEPIIDLSKARHPLIDPKVVVSNDFHMDKSKHLIIISGPNAGGKTVALKTLGLMVMMNQMGLAIPTSKSANLSYFPKIYADIGDNQSLIDNLSTFAAHVSNLSTITHFVSKNDLVLLDELGTGTSPFEGEAIALAISDFLLEKGCFSLISSHFEAMKEYAYKHDGVENAMMVFDDKKLLPTYVLKIGYPGRSYGFEMAKRYHLDDKVIENAKRRLDKTNKRTVNDVIDKLNKLLRENDALKEDLKAREKKLESKEKDLAFKEKSLKKEKENLLSDVNETKEKLINEAIKEIDSIIKTKSDGSKTHELIDMKTRLKKLKEEEEELPTLEDEDIKIDDYVTIDGLGFIGRVISLKGEKIEIITTDGMSVKSTLNKVKKVDAPSNKRVFKSNVDELINLKSDVGLELNIIGEHVDEGIMRLAKYLDDARLKHFSQVRIIHGMGSGALRKAVHEYLKKCDFVKEFHLGGQYDGSTGATIVIFK